MLEPVTGGTVTWACSSFCSNGKSRNFFFLKESGYSFPITYRSEQKLMVQLGIFTKNFAWKNFLNKGLCRSCCVVGVGRVIFMHQKLWMFCQAGWKTFLNMNHTHSSYFTQYTVGGISKNTRRQLMCFVNGRQIQLKLFIIKYKYIQKKKSEFTEKEWSDVYIFQGLGFICC